MARELKVGPLYAKSVSVADRTAVGIYSVFGNRDLVGDVVWPGAFTKTIQERGDQILHLWMHDDRSVPIAQITGLREVGAADLPPACLAAAPGALGGLEVTRAYLPTPRGEEVWQALLAGVPLQGSHAYDPIKADVTRTADGSPVVVGTAMGGMDDWAVYQGLQDGSLTRNLRELRLWETSDVNWGANEATVAAKGSRADLGALLADLLAHVTALKAGARHSAADRKALNAIHSAVVDLGATNCKGSTAEADPDTEENADKSRAALSALTQIQADLTGLELYLLAT